MDVNELKKMVDESLKKSEEELKESLPGLLDNLEGVDLEGVIDDLPDLVPKMMRKLNEIDSKSFMESAPEASTKFMNLLWASVAIMAEKNAGAKARLEQVGEAKVNFEATDSPLTSYLNISKGKLNGGSGLLDKYDLKIYGPTEVIVELLSGKLNPIQGFMAGKYKMEGSVTLGMKLSPLLTSITDMFK